MGRILAIDYGRKRCGIAVTDVLQLIANSVCTVPAGELMIWLSDYFSREPVERVVLGLPRQMNGEPSESMRYIKPFASRFRQLFPTIPLEYYDERFTSKIAQQAMIDGGLGKKARQEKARVDCLSAAIILRDYLESRRYMSQNQ